MSIEFLPEGGVTSPLGFLAGAARGGIKTQGDDVALIVAAKWRHRSGGFHAQYGQSRAGFGQRGARTARNNARNYRQRGQRQLLHRRTRNAQRPLDVRIGRRKADNART